MFKQFYVSFLIPMLRIVFHSNVAYDIFVVAGALSRLYFYLQSWARVLYIHSLSTIREGSSMFAISPLTNLKFFFKSSAHAALPAATADDSAAVAQAAVGRPKAW
jgi:hypothetical protein